ncbi:MAG: succinylglutamate desuccinylase/aspartoacylase family protein [Bacteroidota bacterium]
MKQVYVKIIILSITFTVGIIASIGFKEMHNEEQLFPGKNITKLGQLSDYFEGIKNTRGDTKVYIFDSGKEGATVFLGGGTHPNEPAGYMAAVVILENIKVDKGRVIVVPRLNNSAFTCNDPMEAYPSSFEIKTDKGIREFRFGSRGTNPLDQWPDPLVYSQYPSGQQYSGMDSRNLNRCFPGRPNGSHTEKVAYAIVQLLKKEKVDIAFDLHEAAPEIPIINAIVYHEKSEEIAMGAILELEFELENEKYAPELSPQNFHGLSHREWGDNTDVLPFLMETSSPIQGRLRGKTNIELMMSGYSPNYIAAKKTGALRIDVRDEGEQLEHRVGRHVTGFKAILSSYNELNPDNTIELSGLPSYEELMTNKIGKYLN